MDVSDDIVDFLREHVDEDLIPGDFDRADDIGHAEWDGELTYPYVTPVSEDPILPGNPSTGYHAMAAGGEGPVQDRVWYVLIDCWGGTVDDNNGVHPDIVANALGHQVSDAFLENELDGYEWISAEPPQTSNDTRTTPTTFRRQVTARLKETT